MTKKKKDLYPRSFTRRLTRGIALTQLIVMGLASYLIYVTVSDGVTEEEFDLYKSYLREKHERVSSVLSDVSVATLNHVAEIEESLDQPDKLYTIMKRMVSDNPRIRSCGISFVANYYPQKGRWFCPYAIRGKDGSVETRTIGDARHDYLKAEWFTKALKAEEGYWSKPFFDSSDTITPLVAYQMPIRDKHGKTVAVVGADLALGWFSSKEVRGMNYDGESVKVYYNTDGDDASLNSDEINASERKWRFLTFYFVIDSDGTFIAHPDSNSIIKDNYFERAKETTDTIDDYVGRQMVAREKGYYTDANDDPVHFEFFDIDGINSYLCYEPIAGTDWSIGLAIPRIMVDIMGMAAGVAMLVLIALGLLVTRIVGRIIIKRATKPLKQLAESANEVSKGNFQTPLPVIKSRDEIHRLRDSFEEMQHSLVRYIDDLKVTTAQNASMESELKVAHDIQMSMLPKTFPPYPNRDDIDIYGTLTPAKGVGGDLFDFYIRDERLYFCIGDVSGKGVPASLVMAVTRSLFRNVSAHVSEPDKIATTLNNYMAEDNESNMFVTLFVGVLDLGTGHLLYSNAGHNSPLLIDKEVAFLPCDANLPIGVMGGWTFSLQETDLTPDSLLFLFTDGLNEAEDANHAQFGTDRMTTVADILLSQGVCRPQPFINKMSDAIHVFVGEAEQSDDLTMLAIQYNNAQCIMHNA